MREKSSKKRSKWRFLRNLRKYPTYFKSKDWKWMMTALASKVTLQNFNIGSISCRGHYHLGVPEAKTVLNCDFYVTEGPRILKLSK